ncbi:MAG: hypothetical protein CMM45_03455 [Rhodospirillaceae bacterium]|nr:hypothetical protein [Rhodospirillaceae bacterium]
MVNPLKNLVNFPIDHFPVGDLPRVKLGHRGNSYGYRCEEFTERGSLNIIFLGDSWTEGAGVTREQTFAHIASQMISEKYGVSVSNWNMAHGGKGYDYFTRILLCSLDILKPDAVFITFPVMDRREYFTIDGELVDLSLGTLGAVERREIDPPLIIKDIYRHWSGLVSSEDDAALAIMNYKLIEGLLKERNIPWGFSFNDWEANLSRVTELMKSGWFDAAKYLGEPFDRIDRVSDSDAHPGPASHDQFGKKVGDWIVNRCGKNLEKSLENSRKN